MKRTWILSLECRDYRFGEVVKKTGMSHEITGEMLSDVIIGALPLLRRLVTDLYTEVSIQHDD